MWYDKKKIKEVLLGGKSSDHLLDGQDYDHGEIETLKAGLDATKKLGLGMTRILIKKGVLTVDEATTLIYESQD